jgi:membrane protein
MLMAEGITTPPTPMTVWQSSCALAAHCWRQLQRHRAEGMAAELTYRTIFALVPLFVLGLVLFRVVGGLEDVQQRVEEQLFSYFGVPEAPLILEDPAAPSGADATAQIGDGLSDSRDRSGDRASNGSRSDADRDERLTEEERKRRQEAERREFQAGIRTRLRDVMDKVSSLDFASLGVVGLLLFVYAAIGLVQSVEYVFNIIYDSPGHRPLHLQLAIHWSIITLGSGMLAMSLYLSGRVLDYAGVAGLGPINRLWLSHGLALLASWVLLCLLYWLMPNTRVSLRAAAIGALVAAVLWELAKWGFQVYVVRFLPYSKLYGSLGLIPLFLFWIYVTWWIILFGLIWAYTLQTWPGGMQASAEAAVEELTIHEDPQWILPVLVEIGRAFGNGNAVTAQELAQRLGMSARVADRHCQQLTDAGWVHRIAGANEDRVQYSLAKPADQIPLSDVMAMVEPLPEVARRSHEPAWRYIAQLRQQQLAVADGKTLADCLVG